MFKGLSTWRVGNPLSHDKLAQEGGGATLWVRGNKIVSRFQYMSSSKRKVPHFFYLNKIST